MSRWPYFRFLNKSLKYISQRVIKDSYFRLIITRISILKLKILTKHKNNLNSNLKKSLLKQSSFTNQLSLNHQYGPFTFQISFFKKKKSEISLLAIQNCILQYPILWQYFIHYKLIELITNVNLILSIHQQYLERPPNTPGILVLLCNIDNEIVKVFSSILDKFGQYVNTVNLRAYFTPILDKIQPMQQYGHILFCYLIRITLRYYRMVQNDKKHVFINDDNLSVTIIFVIPFQARS